MGARTARLNLRLPEDELAELEAISQRKGFKTISEAARDALDQYFETEAAAWNAERLPVTLPRALVEQASLFVSSGDAVDLEQAIALALAEWCEARRRYYLEGREELRRKVSEAAEERAADHTVAEKARRMGRR